MCRGKICFKSLKHLISWDVGQAGSRNSFVLDAGWWWIPWSVWTFCRSFLNASDRTAGALFCRPRTSSIYGSVSGSVVHSWTRVSVIRVDVWSVSTYEFDRKSCTSRSSNRKCKDWPLEFLLSSLLAKRESPSEEQDLKLVLDQPWDRRLSAWKAEVEERATADRWESWTHWGYEYRYVWEVTVHLCIKRRLRPALKPPSVPKPVGAVSTLIDCQLR